MPTPFTPPPGFGSMPEAGAEAPNTVNPAAAGGALLVDPGGKDGALVSQAIVTLTPAKSSGKGSGTVRFAALPDGVRVKADVSGLSFLSKYTLYVHVTGDCSADDLSSAGPTFNFDGSSLNPPDPRYGGLVELTADISGNAKAEAKIPGAYIQGPFSMIGRTVVLHAGGADQKNGAGQQRVACGTIGVAADFAVQ
jgi:Cu-Zn family superoxide dismutase